MDRLQMFNNTCVRDLTTCILCTQPFEEPRVLPCQHSFCTSCLKSYLDTQQQRSRLRLNTLRCPTCFQATSLPVRGVNSFPVDIKAEKVKELIKEMGMQNILRKTQLSLERGRPSSWAFNEDFNVSQSEVEVENIPPSPPPPSKSSPPTSKPTKLSPSPSHPSKTTILSPLSKISPTKQATGTAASSTKTPTAAVISPPKSPGSKTSPKTPPPWKNNRVTDIKQSLFKDKKGSEPASPKSPLSPGSLLTPVKKTPTKEVGTATEQDSVDVLARSKKCGPDNQLNTQESATQTEQYCNSLNITQEKQRGRKRSDQSIQDYSPQKGNPQLSQQAKRTCINIDINSNHQPTEVQAHEGQLQSGRLSNKNWPDNEEELLHNEDCISVTNDTLTTANSCGYIGEHCALVVDKQAGGYYQGMAAVIGEQLHSPTMHYTNGEATDCVMDSPEDFEFLPVYTSPPVILWEHEKCEHDQPTAAAFTGNGNLAVTDFGNNHLHIFNSKGEITLTVDNIKPHAVVADNDGNFVVADRKDRTIKVFHDDGTPYFDWDRDCFPWISGVGVTTLGQFVVLDREFCRIGVYNSEGNVISEFGSHGDGDSQLSMANFLAVDSQDRIIICDRAHHCVKIFDTQGIYLGQFGGRGTAPGQMLWPRSVALDDANNILVSDSGNNRISLYSPDGQFIQHMLQKSTISPYNMAFSNCKLAVTAHSLNGHSSVKVYQV